MVINYFDKFDIDTFELKEKLNLISSSNTENAKYLTYILNNALEYLFENVELNLTMVANCLKEEADAVVFFDTILNNNISNKLLEIAAKTNVIIVGKHLNKKINDKIECVDIKDFTKLKNMIKKFSKISIGINVKTVDYSKYYYGRMRSYFLHVVNSLNKISIEELKEDIEGKCTEIMLNDNNFKSEYEKYDELIEFKEIILTYIKILKIKSIFINEKVFFISEVELNNEDKMVLNELDSLIKLFSIKNDDEKISFVYDNICEKMMKEIKKLNYCNFENNKCVTMRYTRGFPNSKENGCCSNTYMDKGKDCRYLNQDHSCKICSISCRVFTCQYLQDRGIDHSLWQYPIIDCSMGKLTRAKLIHNFFIPKEIMMKKLRNKLR